LAYRIASVIKNAEFNLDISRRENFAGHSDRTVVCYDLASVRLGQSANKKEFSVTSSKSKASRKKELAKAQSQRLEKRGTTLSTIATFVGSLEIRPKVDDSERTEDAAVFNKDCRRKLSEELQSEAVCVYEALELTNQGRFEDAIGAVKGIARSSPFSDWRLFIRGLNAFYSADLENARQNWTKLDRARRPARIATTLLIAEFGQALDDEGPCVPESILEHAKTLRLRKIAVDSANAIAKVKHRNPDTTLSVSQVAMLSSFIETYRKLDLEFVTRVGQACVHLAMNQGDMEIFNRLAKMVPGTQDDPKWNRSRMIYSLDFEGAEDRFEDAAIAYLEQDLPKITNLSEQLRNALAHQTLLLRAEIAGRPGDDDFDFSRFYTKVDHNHIDKLYGQAIQKYPSDRLAHKKRIGSLESQLQTRDLSKPDEVKLETQIRIAKEELVRAIPDEVATSLELIDLYLDEDELEKANALVRKLSGQRLESPLAKALPWKLKLRETMRLSRRKSDLVLASKSLDEVESLWPLWLNRNWFPFLKAGLALRGGDKVRFSELTTEARQEQKLSPFVGDVMTFAALQLMNIPSPELKPFRSVVEKRVDEANKIEIDELFAVGSFFWDLVRTGIKHTGYRLQAAKFGRAFVDKIQYRDHSNLTAIQIDAFSWGAHHHYWPLGSDYAPLPWTAKIAMFEPRLAVVVLAWILELKRIPKHLFSNYEPMIPLIEEAARNEKNAFYRYQYEHVASNARNVLAEIRAEEDRSRSYESSSYLDDYDDEEYDDDEDEDDQYDDEYDDDDDSDNLCDCAKCRAKRKRAQMHGVENKIEGAWGLDESNLLDKLPPIVAQVFSRLGPKGMDKFGRIIGATKNHSTPEKFVELVGALLIGIGMSPEDAAKFMFAFLEMSAKRFSGSIGNEEDVGNHASTGMGSQSFPDGTPQDRKAARKQREKQLENRKSQKSKGRNRR
jgi:hypothetical protein